MYLQYWGLARNPFDNVPDPEMYFSEHATVETAIAELLFAIEEGNECLAVVVGEVGLGKTMALRVVLELLDPDAFRIAFITNPDITFVQLMREIIGQLQGQPCTIRSKEPLLEEFNRILFQAADEGRKVLVFIDEGNAMKGANLEALRLLTNMQEDTRNLMTLILAGQPKLARMLEDPRRANLFQRIGVYTRLEPLESVDRVRRYVEHRLAQSGATQPIFDQEAFQEIFRHSGGIPRLINRVCKLSLKAGETNELAVLGADVVKAVAQRFELSRGRNGGMMTATSESPAARTVTVESASAEVEELFVQEALEPVDTQLPYELPIAVADLPPVEPAATAPASAETAVEEPSPVPAIRAVPPPSPLTPVQIRPNGRSGMHAVGTHSAVSLEVAEELSIPHEVVEALRSLADERQQLRLAGQLAARQIQEHPERYTDAVLDPVRAWDLLRNEILRAARCA